MKRTKTIRTFITVVIILCSSAILQANNYKFWLTIQGEVNFNNQPLQNAVVTIYKNGVKEEHSTVVKKVK